MSRLSDTTFPNPFFLAVKMRCITSMGIKIFTIDVAGQCDGEGHQVEEISLSLRILKQMSQIALLLMFFIE